MAIDFPNSPSVNDTHTSAGVTWKWDGTTWKAEGVTSSYSLPTASAIVADLYRISRDPMPLEWQSNEIPIKLKSFNNFIFRHTLRFEAIDSPGIMALIAENLARRGNTLPNKEHNYLRD